MAKTDLIIMIVAAALTNVRPFRAQTAHIEPRESANQSDDFVVGPSAIFEPKGFFLLIRKGHEVGAIRFTSIEPGANRDDARGTYESYFQEDSSRSFLTPDAIRTSGRIHARPVHGNAQFPIQFGSYKIKVGKWSFECTYPGNINMYPYGRSEKDHGYEFAATSAQDVSEIDVSDKRLRWFRFFNDKSVTLPLEKLPK